MKSLSADFVSAAVSLIFNAVVLSAKWAGQTRKKGLEEIAKMDIDEKDKEIAFLRDKVYELQTQVAVLKKRFEKGEKKTRFTIKERLYIIWHLEYFQIPRRKVKEFFGIARSTLYRWLNKIDSTAEGRNEPHNKTCSEIVRLVWEIASTNVDFGRVRIANQLGLLNIFIAASTVRNILTRPRPKDASPSSSQPLEPEENEKSRSIPAWYPNHVWSVDLTIVLCWRIWSLRIGGHRPLFP